MKKVQKFYGYIKDKYTLLSLKRYTTLAGTLVFFFIMSIMPLAFWLSLIVGKLPVDTERLFSLSVFSSVKGILNYVQTEAHNATAGASVILIFTTLYSATNLFYQIRRSGELIYDFKKTEKGIKLRFSALLLLIILMAASVAVLLIFAFGSFVFSRILSRALERVADYAFLAILAFLLVLLLNMYICPYKEKASSFLLGTGLTVIAWMGAVVGFSVYLKISNLTRLYGALSTVIVFLLWLYILMICFIAGVIFNSEKILLRRGKTVRGRRKRIKK